MSAAKTTWWWWWRGWGRDGARVSVCWCVGARIQPKVWAEAGKVASSHLVLDEAQQEGNVDADGHGRSRVGFEHERQRVAVQRDAAMDQRRVALGRLFCVGCRARQGGETETNVRSGTEARRDRGGRNGATVSGAKHGRSDAPVTETKKARKRTVTAKHGRKGEDTGKKSRLWRGAMDGHCETHPG